MFIYNKSGWPNSIKCQQPTEWTTQSFLSCMVYMLWELITLSAIWSFKHQLLCLKNLMQPIAQFKEKSPSVFITNLDDHIR